MELQSDDVATFGLRRYVRLVGEELGLSADGYYLELEQPISAYLALDRSLPRFPTQDAALLWDELHGWSMATEPHSTEDLLPQAYLGGEVLPAPRVVARFAARLLRGEDAGQPTMPDLRALEVDDDLAQRLAAYARQAARGHPVASRTFLGSGPEQSVSSLLAVTADRHDSHTCLHFHGEIDLLTAPRLRHSVDNALAQHPESVIVDLTGVEFFGSAGIAILIDAHDRAPDRVRIVAAHPAVLRPLELLGLTTVLAIYPTQDAARTDRFRPAG